MCSKVKGNTPLRGWRGRRQATKQNALRVSILILGLIS